MGAPVSPKGSQAVINRVALLPVATGTHNSSGWYVGSGLFVRFVCGLPCFLLCLSSVLRFFRLVGLFGLPRLIHTAFGPPFPSFFSLRKMEVESTEPTEGFRDYSSACRHL